MHVQALVKYKFYDFVVNELFNGVPVDLTEPAPVFPEFQRTIDFFDASHKQSVQHDMSPLSTFTTLPEDILTKLTTFLQEAKPNSKFEFSVPNASKEIRTSFHQFFKTLNNPLLESRTGGQNFDLIQLSFHAKMQFPQPSDKARFWNAVLLKQNIDTMQAIDLICNSMRFQKLQNKNINYCGTKDQRGVTQQVVQFPGYIFPEAICQNLPNNIKIGSFTHAHTQIGLGSHEGNQFIVCLRALGLKKCTNIDKGEFIANNLQQIVNIGLLNKFGTQRFGSGVIKTDLMGQALSQGRMRLFVKMLAVNDHGIKNGLTEEQTAFFTKYFATIMADNKIEVLEGEQESTFMKYYDEIKEYVVKNNRPFQLSKVLQILKKPVMEETNESITNAISQAMPINSRTFYFHAFQSRIFNQLCDEINTIDPQNLLSNKYGSVTQVKTTPYTSADLCLPLIGFNTLKELSPVSQFWTEKCQNIMNGLGIENIDGKYRDIFAPGSFRKVYTQVKNMQFAVKAHEVLDQQIVKTKFDNNEMEELIFSTDFESIKQFKTETEQYISIVLKFELDSSCYATEVMAAVLGEGYDKEQQQGYVNDM
ncbi:TRNA_pseudouridine synthase [Hexamita inflata]|uniref:tRNA pseudouridine synthase n=1 Tax=Hexamita inflata TaxID=28002 RepID=A0AA86RRG1_9EUKA|nr:TRNA pseudouridine synthase [Hexamita inflata]